MAFDHWTTLDLGEPSSPKCNYIPEKIVLKRGPRLEMWNYTYPEEFIIGHNPRVRGLNAELLQLYRLVANATDIVAAAQEKYDFFGPRDLHAESSLDAVTQAEGVLDKLLDDVEPLLAEVSAIGGQFLIPPKLQNRIALKNYVEAGTLDNLIGADLYFEEVDGIPENHKNALERLSFNVNRMVFLQHCGAEFTESQHYNALCQRASEYFELLQANQFPLDTIPALVNQVQHLLGLQHGEDGLQHDEDGLQHDEDGLQHDEDGLEHDEDGLQHDDEVEAQPINLHLIFVSSDEEDEDQDHGLPEVAAEEAGVAQPINLHLIFVSSDDEDEDQDSGLPEVAAEEAGPRHIIFVSSDEE